MKCFLTLTIVFLLAGAQALAQTDSKNVQAASASDRRPLASPARLTPGNLADVQSKVRSLYAALARDKNNQDCRLELAQDLESLALYAERNRDYLNAWRYYEGAAQVLDYPGDGSQKKRAAKDAEKAESNHKLRLDYIKNLKLVGWVYTTFNWHDYKNLETKQGADYQSAVGLPIRRNWSFAERMLHLRLPHVASPKPMLIVSFNVHRNGTLSDIKVAKSCGQPKIDEIAMQAVKDVGKAPPLLPAMGDVVPFQAQFIK
jgi:TonB family protein